MQAVEPYRWRAVLERVLAPPGQSLADAAHVAAFERYLAVSAGTCDAWRAGPPECPTALVVALRLPGRTALVMLPEPGGSILASAQQELLHAALEHLRPTGLHFVQALVDPSATGQVGCLTSAGFAPLATLLYLERDVRYPWSAPPAPHAAEWFPYSPATHKLLADTILATYIDSRDCPGLTGLRPIEDVLAAHRASGVFTPELWEIARVDGAPAGCLLLAPLAAVPVIELVYMGVVPEFRRRGVGALLLRRALAQCRAQQARRLTVVVDAANAPAVTLYRRFACEQVAERTAFMYRWR